MRSAAALGLMTGTVQILPSPEDTSPVLSIGSMLIRFDDEEFEKAQKKKVSEASVLEYMRASGFQSAMEAVAKTFAWLSLNSPDIWDRIMQLLGDAGSTGLLVCRPAGNLWPDAIRALLPEIEQPDYFDEPSRRCFPVASMLDIVAVENVDPASEADWCRENPESLSVHFVESADAMQYTGWNRQRGTAVTVTAAVQDFRNPWRAVSRGGIEEIIPAVPMVQTDPLFNSWDLDPRFIPGKPDSAGFSDS